MSTVKIIEVSKVRVAKDGRQYFVAALRPGLGQRPVRRTFWEQFKRDANGVNTEEKFWDRMSPTEAQEALKDRTGIEARKETRTVETYEVNGRMVNSYSAIIFPDETVEGVFIQQNKVIVDPTTGEALYTLKEKAVLAPEEEEGNKQGEGEAAGTAEGADVSKPEVPAELAGA